MRWRRLHREQWVQRVLDIVISFLWFVLSVLDYGLGLTTMSQIDLWKLDIVQNDEALVILGWFI